MISNFEVRIGAALALVLRSHSRIFVDEYARMKDKLQCRENIVVCKDGGNNLEGFMVLQRRYPDWVAEGTTDRKEFCSHWSNHLSQPSIRNLVNNYDEIGK